MEKEVVERILNTIMEFSGVLGKEIETMNHTVISIQVMADDGTLTIPYLKRVTKRTFEQIDTLMSQGKRHEKMCERLLDECTSRSQLSKIEHFCYVFDNYKVVVQRFKEFIKGYENYQPRNAKEICRQVNESLQKRGFVVDGYFEGDFATWVGVYARPIDKPTYLDALTDEDAELQEKYRDENGFKRDFAEWFEWEIVNGQIIEE